VKDGPQATWKMQRPKNTIHNAQVPPNIRVFTAEKSMNASVSRFQVDGALRAACQNKRRRRIVTTAS
jgi:hypothetical protein